MTKGQRCHALGARPPYKATALRSPRAELTNSPPIPKGRYDNTPDVDLDRATEAVEATSDRSDLNAGDNSAADAENYTVDLLSNNRGILTLADAEFDSVSLDGAQDLGPFDFETGNGDRRPAHDEFHMILGHDLVGCRASLR